LSILDTDNGMCSLVEFIYSCRESYDSPFPKLTSQTAINALELIKKIKEDIASGMYLICMFNYFKCKIIINK